MVNEDLNFLKRSALLVAPRLLGCELVARVDGHSVRVRIVETESYDQSDAASHSYNGKTPRTEVMFGPAGKLYVYFTYGMHYCANIVTGAEGHGEAVLIRAVEPLEDIAHVLSRRRGGRVGIERTNGPAKLCYALGITHQQNGHNLSQEPLQLIKRPPIPKEDIIRAPRVGISKEKEKLWRFYIRSNPYVSVK